MEKDKEEPKLSTDEDSSLTINESCVRSDIANLISKIYTPRPITLNYSAGDNSPVWRDLHGEGGWRETEDKRFGFYFSPVARTRLTKAKPILDSSTSDSVSLPYLTFKPKRVRHVCECCKRKTSNIIVHARRKKQMDCKICRRNNCVDAESSTNTSARKVEPLVHARKKTRSHNDIIQIHPTPFLRANEVKESMKSVQTQSEIIDDTELNKTLKINIESEKGQPTEVCAEETADGNHPLLTRIISLVFGRVRERASKMYKSDSIIIGKTVKTEYSKGVLGQEVTQKQMNIWQSSKSIKHVSIEDKKSKNYTESRHAIKSTLIELEQSQVPETDEKLNTEVLSSEVCNQTYHLSECEQENKTSDIPLKESNSNNSLKSTGTQKQIEPVSGFENHKNQSTQADRDTSNGGRYLKEEKNKEFAYEFWAEFFGTCDFFVSFITAFVLNFLRFLLQSIIQPFLCGTTTIMSDYFFKPCLLTLYDSLLQPILNFLLNLAVSFRDLCFPVAQCFGFFCKEISHICGACRIVEIHKHYNKSEDFKRA